MKKPKAAPLLATFSSAMRGRKAVTIRKPPTSSSEMEPEHRRTRRFPICLDLRYRVLGPEVRPGECGIGRTSDISSTEIQLSTARRLPLGKGVELSIAWPVMLDGHCPLNLVAVGAVVRAEETCAAIRIHRYEFKTRQRNDAAI